MEQKTAIITGATRGIGKELFIRLGKQGINVATVYSRDDRAAGKIEEFVSSLIIRKIDILNIKKMEEFIIEVSDKFGRIDYLVNNVGVNIYKNICDVHWKNGDYPKILF